MSVACKCLTSVTHICSLQHKLLYRPVLRVLQCGLSARTGLECRKIGRAAQYTTKVPSRSFRSAAVMGEHEKVDLTVEVEAACKAVRLAAQLCQVCLFLYLY